MINKTKFNIVSFDPVVMHKWIIKISVNKDTSNICVVMIHQHSAKVCVGFLNDEIGANRFIITQFNNTHK